MASACRVAFAALRIVLVVKVVEPFTFIILYPSLKLRERRETMIVEFCARRIDRR
jgi:hypothetical protein